MPPVKNVFVSKTSIDRQTFFNRHSTKISTYRLKKKKIKTNNKYRRVFINMSLSRHAYNDFINSCNIRDEAYNRVLPFSTNVVQRRRFARENELLKEYELHRTTLELLWDDSEDSAELEEIEKRWRRIEQIVLEDLFHFWTRRSDFPLPFYHGPLSVTDIGLPPLVEGALALTSSLVPRERRDEEMWD